MDFLLNTGGTPLVMFLLQAFIVTYLFDAKTKQGRGSLYIPWDPVLQWNNSPI